MVQEVRQVMLNVDEIVAAIHAYRKIAPDFLPEGKITDCKMLNTDSVNITIEIERDGFVRPAAFILKSTELLKPLVCFCLQKSIPLPKDGRKVALFGENAVMLCITRNMDFELPAWIASMRLDQIQSVTALSPADIKLGPVGARA